jgi:hypothetical protein
MDQKPEKCMPSPVIPGDPFESGDTVESISSAHAGRDKPLRNITTTIKSLCFIIIKTPLREF